MTGKVDPHLNDGEFIASEPRHGIRAAHFAEQAIGNGLKQSIADSVTESVIDVLEMIDVETMDGDRRAVARRSSQGLLQPVMKERAVGQAGQRVVMCEIVEFCLGLLTFRDVLEGPLENRALAAAAVNELGSGRDAPDGSIGPHDAKVDIELAPAVNRILDDGSDMIPIV